MRCGIIGFAGYRATILSLAAFVVFLAGGCGGGGDSGTSRGIQGGATVGISVASVSAAGTVFSTSTTTAEATAGPSSPPFDNVLATIEKVALIPGGSDGGPDLDGEPLVENFGSGTGGHVVAVLPNPVVIDLLHLPSPDSADGFAGFLAGIREVPPGSYGKIRLFYSKLEGVRGEESIPFHPTANSHFDVHFVDGALLEVPFAVQGPGGAVAFVAVEIRFVGLKIVENNNRVLMRPQVFAVVEDLMFSVTGTARNVDKAARRFDIDPGEVPLVPASYNGTSWAFRDGATLVDVASSLGIAALDDGAIIEAIGRFGAGGVLAAERVTISFPAVVAGVVVSGTAADGWLPDNTFLVLPAGATDNVTVFPGPNRADARYDNTADPSMTFSDNAVVKGVVVTARGYAAAGGVEAFWISVGP